MKINNIKHKTLFLLVFYLLFTVYCLFPKLVFAAALNFSIPAKEYSVGQQFEAKVFLNEVTEPINALEGSVVFSKEAFKVVDIVDANSVVSLWVEKPNPESVNENGRISYSGILPGGFLGRGYLFSIIFEGTSLNQGSINSESTIGFLADGSGSKVTVLEAKENINISLNATSSLDAIYAVVSDSEKPEDFYVEISKYEGLYDNKLFAVFSAQDKGTGIAFYEVFESNKELSNFEGVSWERAKSPYVLKNQTGKSYVYVKATDKSGNFNISHNILEIGPNWYQKKQFWYIIGLITLLGLCAFVFLRRLSKRHKISETKI